MKKIIFFVVTFLFLVNPKDVLAYNFSFPKNITNFPVYQLNTAYLQKGDIQIKNPDTSQLFYDELKGGPRDYSIISDKDFNLNFFILIPEGINRNGRYSADVSLIKDGKEEKIYNIDSASGNWPEMYEPFTRDYYLESPQVNERLLAGKYKIEIFSKDNRGRYVLKIGDKPSYEIFPLLNIYWQLPLLKLTFLKTSILQFFLTPIAIAGFAAIGLLIIILSILNYFIGVIKESIKHSQAKTLLLTSNGMVMKDEIIKLLQKPAYDVTVAFITTAAKPIENLDYLKRDWEVMKDMGFNIEEVDIEGKKEAEVLKLLELKDIIFVEGGNTFYLLKAMRKCNFEKIIRNLLKDGKVYIGSSAGSVVAGKTIKTAGRFGTSETTNIVKLKNLRGLNLVPFDIYVHFQESDVDIIKKNIKSERKRKKKLRILTDEQALLVQGKDVILIGKGNQIIF